MTWPLVVVLCGVLAHTAVRARALWGTAEGGLVRWHLVMACAMVAMVVTTPPRLVSAAMVIVFGLGLLRAGTGALGGGGPADPSPRWSHVRLGVGCAAMVAMVWPAPGPGGLPPVMAADAHGHAVPALTATAGPVPLVLPAGAHAHAGSVVPAWLLALLVVASLAVAGWAAHRVTRRDPPAARRRSAVSEMAMALVAALMLAQPLVAGVIA